MPYRTYSTDPSWAAAGSNLGNALFPDPARAAQIEGQLLQNRGAQQDIAAQHRGLTLADSLMEAARAGQFDEMYGLAAGMSPQHMNAMPGFALGRAGAPGSNVEDGDLHRMLVGAGRMPGPDTSVSMGRQDQVSARNAAEAFQQAMSVEGMRQAGQDRRHEPDSTAAQRNMEFRVAQRLAQNPGMTEQHAWGLELNDINDRMDDLGNLSLVDAGQGTARRIDVDGASPPPMQVPQAPGMEDLAFDPGEGTGARAAAQGLWNRTAGQVVPSLTAMGPEQAAQQTDIMRLNIMSALRSTNRPLVIEMNLVNSLLPETMGWMQNRQVAQQQTLQVLDLVGQQYMADMQAANDTTLSRNERGEHRARAVQLQRALQIGLQPEAVDRYTGAVGAPPTPRRESPGAQSMTHGPMEQPQAQPQAQPQDQPQTFVNPETGERIMFDHQSQQWVPVQ